MGRDLASLLILCGSPTILISYKPTSRLKLPNKSGVKYKLDDHFLDNFISFERNDTSHDAIIYPGINAAGLTVQHYLTGAMRKGHVGLSGLSVHNNTKNEILALKTRVEKLEKTIISQIIQNPAKPKSAVSLTLSSIFDSITSTIELNSKTVETCSIISFFFIGAIIASSLYDRLWLFGGIMMSWWASGAVRSDTSAGMLTRKVGVQLAQFIRDVQEKLNRAIIFYRTGKVAYVSSKIWEKYDTTFAVTKRLNLFKILATNHAVEFNNYLGKSTLSDSLWDFWKVLAFASDKASGVHNQYGVTYSIFKYSQAFMSYASDIFSEVSTIISESEQNGNIEKVQKSTFFNPFNILRANSDSIASNDEVSHYKYIPFFLQNYQINRRLQSNRLKRGRSTDPFEPFWDYFPWSK